MSLFVAVIVIFNMGIAMTAEYTAVGDLFEYVLGAPRWPIVVIIGVVAMLYTAAGGLYVSIITDQWQVGRSTHTYACKTMLTGREFVVCHMACTMWLDLSAVIEHSQFC